MANQFDDINFDVNSLLEREGIEDIDNQPSTINLLNYIKSQISFYWYALLIKSGLLSRLIYANFFLVWFYEFRDYWQNCLGGRPIELPDFFYLKGVYRSKAQDLEVSEAMSLDEQLKVWQDPRTIYLLFHWQYRYAFCPLMNKYIKWVKKQDKVLEYGCGIAPITTALVRFKRQLNIKTTCTDIPTIWLHFAQWKFRKFNFVKIIPLDPKNEAPIKDKYDIIFCREVLEHIHNPLSTVEHFYERLNPGGILIFDWRLTEGSGLDSISSIQQRPLTINFIKNHFKVKEGNLSDFRNNIDFCVVQKS